MTDLQSAIQRALYQAALEGDVSPRITLSERTIEILMGAVASPKVNPSDMRALKDALCAPGRSQTGLAEFLGLHPSSISKMLRGDRQIKARELENIETYLARTARIPATLEA